jgi:predicted secreted protein
MKAVRPEALQTDVAGLRQQLAEVERAIARITDAIAAGGPIEALLVGLKQRQTRCDELRIAIAAREAATVRTFDPKTIEATVRAHAKRWRELLTSHVQDGRQLLREILVGPLRLTPEGRSYRFEGEAALGTLVAGKAGLPTVLASPMPASWNRIAGWLRQINDLRHAA